MLFCSMFLISMLRTAENANVIKDVPLGKNGRICFFSYKISLIHKKNGVEDHKLHWVGLLYR